MVQPWLRFHIPLIEPDRQISRIRLVWGCFCQGEYHARFWLSFVMSFHSFVRPAPRAFFRPDGMFPSPSRATAVKDSVSSALPDASTAAGCRRSGGWPRDDPRGACHWPRSIREPRLYSVEPVWGPDHEAVIRFCGQGSEAAGPFSQRHCSHSRMRIAATSDRHRLPSASSAVRCRTLFVLSRSRVLLTPPAAARHRPAPRRS